MHEIGERQKQSTRVEEYLLCETNLKSVGYCTQINRHKEHIVCFG